MSKQSSAMQEEQVTILMEELLKKDKEIKEETGSEEATKQVRQQEKIQHIPLDTIDSFPDHPYQVRDDKEMEQLTISVKEQGVVSPAIVRQKDDGRYELISGHRRKRASELAQLSTMPVIVCELTDDQSAVLMVESNCQREKILASEKANAYKIRMDAQKKQGKRNDLTSTPVVAKSRTGDEIGTDVGESREQVRRYIRLTELIPPLLKMVDEGKIAFRPAIEISYLLKKEQRLLLAAIEREVATPSLAQAIKLKSASKEETLTAEAIASIMQQPKPNQKELVRIPKESISKYFKKDDTTETIKETIIKALEMYRKRERSREMER